MPRILWNIPSSIITNNNLLIWCDFSRTKMSYNRPPFECMFFSIGPVSTEWAFRTVHSFFEIARAHKSLRAPVIVVFCFVFFRLDFFGDSYFGTRGGSQLSPPSFCAKNKNSSPSLYSDFYRSPSQSLTIFAKKMSLFPLITQKFLSGLI